MLSICISCVQGRLASEYQCDPLTSIVTHDPLTHDVDFNCVSPAETVACTDPGYDKANSFVSTYTGLSYCASNEACIGSTAVPAADAATLCKVRLPVKNADAVQIRTLHDDKVVDWDTNAGSKMHMWDAHTGVSAVQRWYIEYTDPDRQRFKIISSHDNGKCIQINYSTKKVETADCLPCDSADYGCVQEWYIDHANGGSGRNNAGHMKTTRVGWPSSKCLDYNYNNNEIYFHNCHGGANQKFYFGVDANLYEY